MISKIFRWTGIISIFLFCIVCIFSLKLKKDIGEGAMTSSLAKIANFAEYFENRFYDKRMLLTTDETNAQDWLMLSEIGDEDLDKMGRWPWPRKTWVEIMRKYKLYGAKVVAFDIIFSEPELACGSEKPDQIFAKTIQDFESVPGNKVIIPYSLSSLYQDDNNISFTEFPDILFNYMLETREIAGKSDRKLFTPQRINKSTFPIKALQEVEPALSFIGARTDSDGIFRHYPLIALLVEGKDKIDEGLYFPSFSLQAYQLYTGDHAKVEIGAIDETIVKLKNGDILLNSQGETKIRWSGGIDTFDRVSIWDMLQASDDDQRMRSRFENKIVFVGSTAFGAHDIRHTPVDPKLPGVYFHMNMTQMLLKNYFFKPMEESTLWSWSILIIGSILMLLIQFMGQAIYDLLFVSIFSISAYLFDTFYLLPKGYDITLFFALASIIGIYIWNTIISFYFTSKDKQFLKSAFGNYISPELIDIMYEKGEVPKLGGDVGLRTAYFTDIQGFSTFSEQLSAPKLVELLNEYLTAMTDILLEQGGTLDKYEGDAIIAFFGAPMEQEDHAERAIYVAHLMQEKLSELRIKWKQEGDKWPDIVKEMRMRIGVNSGEIVTGNMGSKSRMNYTMMGDSVNLAARLEEAAKEYGIFTHISQFTKELVDQTRFSFRELDTIKVMGKTEPVKTFDLLGETKNLSNDLIKLQQIFSKGLSLYKKQKWDEAITAFNECEKYELKRYNLKARDNPSSVYIRRCQGFQKSPPGDNWDGVYTLTSK